MIDEKRFEDEYTFWKDTLDDLEEMIEKVGDKYPISERLHELRYNTKLIVSILNGMKNGKVEPIVIWLVRDILEVKEEVMGERGVESD